MIEMLAIRRVFGEHAGEVAISSIKSMLGHLITAARAVELITCVLAIRDGAIPPTINYGTPDPNCDLDYVPNEARKLPVRVALSNRLSIQCAFPLAYMLWSLRLFCSGLTVVFGALQRPFKP